MADPIDISDATFQSEVIESDVPVLVDFWADWCGPCKMVAPVVKDLAGEYRRQGEDRQDGRGHQPSDAHAIRGAQHPDALDLQGRRTGRPGRRRRPEVGAQGPAGGRSLLAATGRRIS